MWFSKPSIEELASRSANTMATCLGMVFTEVGDDYLVAKMPVDARTKQPLGILNGGASCALAETVGSTAANYCVDQSLVYCVGLDLNANHLKSATEGAVWAKAKPIHLGKKTQVWEIAITDDSHAMICIARLTMMVMVRKEGQ